MASRERDSVATRAGGVGAAGVGILAEGPAERGGKLGGKTG